MDIAATVPSPIETKYHQHYLRYRESFLRDMKKRRFCEVCQKNIAQGSWYNHLRSAKHQGLILAREHDKLLQERKEIMEFFSKL